MPQIPVYGGGAPTVQSTPTPIVRGGNTAPDLSGVSRGVADLAQGVNSIRITMAETAAKELDIETSEAIRSLLNDPERGYLAMQGKNAVDGYEPTRAALQKIVDDRASSIQDGMLKSAYLGVAQRRLESAFGSVDAHARQANVTWQNQTAEARLSAAMNDAVANYTDPQQVALQINTGFAELDEIAARSGWTPEVLGERKRAYESGTLKAIIARRASTSYTDAAAFFEANKDRLTAADAVSSDAVIRQAEAERRARAAEAREAFASDFLIAMRRGEKTYSDIEAAYEQGYITPSARASMTLYLDEQVAREQERANDMMRVEAAGSGGPLLDPSSTADRKALNQHFEAVAETWTSLPPDEVVDRAVDYAVQKGMIPDRLQGMVAGQLRAGSPAQQVHAADTIQKLRSANPELLKDFTNEDISRGNLIAQYVSYGAPPERAVELATEAMQVDENVRQARDREYAEKVKETMGVGLWGATATGPDPVLKDAFGPTGFFSMFRADPEIEAAVGAEFDALARAEYQRHGNFDAARTTALDHITRTWGTTEIGGEKRVMKWAPEKYYGIPALSASENSEWMQRQLEDDVRGIGGMFESDIDGRLMLTPGGTFSDGLPFYRVGLMGSDGIPRLVMNDKGEPMRWVPQWETSAKAKELAERREELVEDARRKRSERGTPTGAGQTHVPGIN